MGWDQDGTGQIDALFWCEEGVRMGRRPRDVLDVCTCGLRRGFKYVPCSGEASIASLVNPPLPTPHRVSLPPCLANACVGDHVLWSRIAKRTFDDDKDREAGILWDRSVLSPSKYRVIGNMFCIRSYTKVCTKSLSSFGEFWAIQMPILRLVASLI